jgi:protein-S-isoprenylcysteine O-methyltransferase Ste14
MGKVFAFLYGVVSYAIFLGVLLYTVGFLANFWVPKSIDSGAAGPLGQAILINLALLSLFAVQHSVMARPGFKRWWCQFVPKPVERATYVLLTNAVLILLFWQWRPMPEIVWEAGGMWRNVIWGIYVFGIVLAVYATFLIDHFDLFGLRQVWIHLKDREYTDLNFVTPTLYRIVRHPLYIGWFVIFWAAPTMTQGHLLFAAVATAYTLVAIRFEERDLVDFLPEYRQYQEDVPMIIPFAKGKPGGQKEA